MRSAVADGVGGWIGLAMVSKLHVTADARLAFAAGGGWSDNEPPLPKRRILLNYQNIPNFWTLYLS